MSADDYSEDVYTGPAFALVVGISNYQYGRPQDQPFGPKEFPNLKVARQDAADFAKFLGRKGLLNEYNVRTLLDEQATLKAIRRELGALETNCRESAAENPLVVVYFSGHGWAGSYNKHYLIPYDGERDDLAGS